jgi:hypothetical protein
MSVGWMQVEAAPSEKTLPLCPILNGFIKELKLGPSETAKAAHTATEWCCVKGAKSAHSIKEFENEGAFVEALELKQIPALRMLKFFAALKAKPGSPASGKASHKMSGGDRKSSYATKADLDEIVNSVTASVTKLLARHDDALHDVVEMHEVLAKVDGLMIEVLKQVQTGLLSSNEELKKQIAELHRTQLEPLANHTVLAVQSAKQKSYNLSDITEAMNTALATVQKKATKANQKTMADMLDEMKKLLEKNSNSQELTVVALQGQLSKHMCTLTGTVSDSDYVKKIREEVAEELKKLEGAMNQLLSN